MLTSYAHVHTLSRLFALLFSLSLALSPVATCASVHMHTHTYDTPPNQAETPLMSPSCKSLIKHSSSQKRFCPLPQPLLLSLSHKIVCSLQFSLVPFLISLFKAFFRYHPNVKNTLRFLIFISGTHFCIFLLSPPNSMNPNSK